MDPRKATPRKENRDGMEPNEKTASRFESMPCRKETVASRFITSLEKVRLKESLVNVNAETNISSPPSKVPVLLSTSPPSLSESDPINSSLEIMKTEPSHVIVDELTQVLDSTCDHEALMQSSVVIDTSHVESLHKDTCSDDISIHKETDDSKQPVQVPTAPLLESNIKDACSNSFHRSVTSISSESSLVELDVDMGSEDAQNQSTSNYERQEENSENEFGWVSEMPFGSEELSFSSQESEEEGVYKLNKLFGGRLFEEDRKKLKKKPTGQAADADKLRANYFVGIRISNHEIHAKVKKVQELLLEKMPVLKKAIIPLETLHVTLVVLQIADEKELKRACDCLKGCEPDLIELVKSPLHLEFEGLSHFQNQVLFCQTKSEEPLKILKQVSETLAKAFRSADIKLSDSKAFNPHLTVVKLSRAPGLYKKGIKKIDPAWYIYYKNEMFGVQEVQEIQLLRMGPPKAEDGYYYSVYNFPFDFYNQSTNVISAKKNEKSVNKFMVTDKVKKDVRRKIHMLTTSVLENLLQNERGELSNTDDCQMGSSVNKQD